MNNQKETKVFIERASPLTKNGIRSMCCSDEEYNWYVRGLEDGRQSAQKEFEDLIRKEKEIVKRVCLGLVQDSLEKIWNNKQDDEWEKI